MVRSKRGDDAGAAAAEYVGVIVLVTALIIAVHAAGIGKQIGDRIVCLFDTLTGSGSCSLGEGEQGPEADPLKPVWCQVASAAVNHSGEGHASVAFIGFGAEADYGFEQTKYTDSQGRERVELTFSDAAGVEGSVGKNLNSAEVELTEGVTIGKGDTWVFDSQEEADKFRRTIEKYKRLDRFNDATRWSLVGAGTNVAGLFDKGPVAEEKRLRNEINEALRKRHITTGRVGVQQAASIGVGAGTAGVSGGNEPPGQDNEKPSFEGIDVMNVGVEANAEAHRSAEVEWTKDDTEGTKSYTFTGTGGGSADAAAGAKAAGKGAGAGAEAAYERAAAYTMTFDQHTEELVSLTVKNTATKTAGAGADATGAGRAAAGGSGVEVTETTVDFTKAGNDRRTAELRSLLAKSAGDPDTLRYLLSNDIAPARNPGARDPFGQLLYEQGESATYSYGNHSQSDTTGADIDLKVIGVGGSHTRSEQNLGLKNASFLASPDGSGERRMVPLDSCVH